MITALDYAKERHGVDTVKERILQMHTQHARKGILFQVKNIDNPLGAPVYARLENGHWIADCECNGAEFVDPTEPIFFCFACANKQNSNRVRPVVFPKKIKEIEAMLMKRPVSSIRGLDRLQEAEAEMPEIMVEGFGLLARSWNPGETIKDLRNQQDAPIKAWKKRRDK